MNERLTIADSKRAFHNAFPHVIPPIYRRVADELLVELHLLSHQQDFKPDRIFAIGLTKVFDTFTRGYKPEKHLDRLFKALCKSNGFDPVLIREQSEKVLNSIQGQSFDEISNWLRNKGQGAPDQISNELDYLSGNSNHYSRLFSIGLLSLLEEAQGETKTKENIEATQNIIIESSENLGFSKSRVERDLNQYSSNIEKLSQALEVMREAIKHEKNKTKVIETTIE